MNTSLNLLFIDELVDSGMDTMGVESAMSVLKKMSREGGKNIFLISHRDELTSRCSNVLNVVKENGFTSMIYLMYWIYMMSVIYVIHFDKAKTMDGHNKT